MSDWNSEEYLKFKHQRTQPAIDLAKRIQEYPFRKIVDIGCGPGNSTDVLRSVFPHASILGIDNSPNMIEKAKSSYPDIKFQLCDVHSLACGYDLFFSNACFQWIPDHQTLIPELLDKLDKGGILAVQMPMNGEEPLFKIIHEVANNPKWHFDDVWFETNETLSPASYFNILSGCTSRFDMWETVYYHNLPSYEALIDWVRGSRLRPYLDVLDDVEAKAFEKEILDLVVQAYPVMDNGDVVLRFRRFFFIAYK